MAKVYLTPEDLAEGRFDPNAKAEDIVFCQDADEASRREDGTHERSARLSKCLATVLEQYGEDTLRTFIRSLEARNGRLDMPPSFDKYRS